MHLLHLLYYPIFWNIFHVIDFFADGAQTLLTKRTVLNADISFDVLLKNRPCNQVLNYFLNPFTTEARFYVLNAIAFST